MSEICYIVFMSPLDHKTELPVQSGPQVIPAKEIDKSKDPFYRYQEIGYFPWKASLENRSVGEELSHILEKIPNTDREQQKRLFDFVQKAMLFAAEIYRGSFGSTEELRPVYHGTNPEAGTVKAMEEKTCGHGESVCLTTMIAYAGACIGGEIEFDEDVFKTLSLAALTHEGIVNRKSDWFSCKNENRAKEKVREFFGDHDIDEKFFNLIYSLNKFGQTPETVVKQYLDLFQLQYCDSEKSDEWQEQMRIAVVYAKCFMFGDWAGQMLNENYPEAIGCLASEFSKFKPDAKRAVSYWYNKDGSINFSLVGADGDFFEDFAQPGYEAGMEYADRFFGGEENNPFHQQVIVLKRQVERTDRKRRIYERLRPWLDEQ